MGADEDSIVNMSNFELSKDQEEAEGADELVRIEVIFYGQAKGQCRAQ